VLGIVDLTEWWCWQVAASELDDSRTAGVEYSIVRDNSEDRSAAEFFSIATSTGIISTKASVAQFGTLLFNIVSVFMVATIDTF